MLQSSFVYTIFRYVLPHPFQAYQAKHDLYLHVDKLSEKLWSVKWQYFCSHRISCLALISSIDNNASELNHQKCLGSELAVIGGLSAIIRQPILSLPWLCFPFCFPLMATLSRILAMLPLVLTCSYLRTCSLIMAYLFMIFLLELMVSFKIVCSKFLKCKCMSVLQSHFSAQALMICKMLL